MNKKRYIYVPVFSYGSPSLSKMEVVKETPKTFKIGEITAVMGHKEWARVFSKESVHFESARDAVQYLADRGLDVIARNEQGLLELKEKTATLFDLLDELDKEPTDD